ncbi:MAG: SDR family oxidoreductase [Chloroflexi bacterium]|nr:SDR family oxidoreductase [Chloroflexota bacterium]
MSASRRSWNAAAFWRRAPDAVKLFITGISGLLGLNIALQARERFQVSGCYHAHPVRLDGVQSLGMDLATPGQWEAALRETQPDVVIHTAGLTSVEGCEADPVLAQRLNVGVAQDVATVAREVGVRLVHISTDHLFDGTRPWRTEADRPAPLNVYARTKWEAEQAVLEACPDALIIRTNFFGWGTPVRPSFSDWVLRGLEEGRELHMFLDVFFTPILINSLGELLLELVERGTAGVFHVAGGERLSKYEFGLKLAETFGYPSGRIRPSSVDEFPFKAQRPKDMSLRTDAVTRLLGRQMPLVSEGLARLRRLGEAGWPTAVGAALQGADTLKRRR